MADLKCSSCGAPLKVGRKARRVGAVTCEYCGNAHDLGGADPIDAETKKGLRALTRYASFLGVDLAALDEPAERPYDTKIELENRPGRYFRASVPPAGFSAGSIPLIVFAVFWCGFMVVWNAIALFTGAWPMALFGVLHDAVGIGLALAVLWSLFGREEIEAKGGVLTRRLELLGFKRVREYPWQHIDGFSFEAPMRSGNRTKTQPALSMQAGSKKVKLAGNASVAELRWVRTELERFFDEAR